jgi:pilus assembly protein CpaE
MGVCASMLDLKPATTLTDAVHQRDRLDEMLLQQLTAVHPCGLHLLAAPADAVEAAEIDDEAMSQILTLARRAYDYVLVDTFPMLDRVMMTVLDLSDRSYVIVESIVPVVLGAAKLLQLLDKMGSPRERQRLILNRYTGKSDNLKSADVAERLNRPIDHVLPFQKKLSVAINLGRPFILSASRWWGLGKALHRLIEDIDEIQPSARPARNSVAAEPSVNGVVEAEEANLHEP